MSTTGIGLKLPFMISAGLSCANLALACAEPVNMGCELSQMDKVANRKLSFQQFDQENATRSNARSLGESGCWREAAEATADYLMNGPEAGPNEHRMLVFHLGQQLALAGEERGALIFILSSQAEGQRGELNWNDYVKGTAAFLRKDLGALQAARDAVLASPGEGNRMNGSVLEALVRCFDKTYSLAYLTRCGNGHETARPSQAAEESQPHPLDRCRGWAATGRLEPALEALRCQQHPPAEQSPWFNGN